MENIEFEKDKNGKVIVYGRSHTPMTSVKAILTYNDVKKTNYIPIFYGRYGNELYFKDGMTEADIEARADLVEYFKRKYEELRPEKVDEWKVKIEKKYKKNTEAHKLFRALFEKLNCRVSTASALPGNNNPQKPLQHLREDGLCIMTEVEDNVTYATLIEGIFSRGFQSEMIPETVRKRTLDIYGNIDALSGKKMSDNNLIIEHKFPEERWKDRPAEDNSKLSNNDIIRKFQLLTPQYNQVKREACKRCVTLGKRQAPFEITYFYEGDENWSCDVEYGPDAEDGCIGCGWYDVAKWKAFLIEAANGEDEEDEE